MTDPLTPWTGKWQDIWAIQPFPDAFPRGCGRIGPQTIGWLVLFLRIDADISVPWKGKWQVVWNIFSVPDAFPRDLRESGRISGGMGQPFPDAFPGVSYAAGMRRTQVGWLPSGGAPTENAGVSRAQS